MPSSYGTLGSLMSGGMTGRAMSDKASPTGSPGSFGSGAFGGMSSPTGASAIGEGKWGGGVGTPGFAGGFGNFSAGGFGGAADRRYDASLVGQAMPMLMSPVAPILHQPVPPSKYHGGGPPPMQYMGTQPDIVRYGGPLLPAPAMIRESLGGVPSYTPALPGEGGFGQPDIVRNGGTSMPLPLGPAADVPPQDMGTLGDVMGDGMYSGDEQDFLPMSERRRASGRMA